MSMRVITLQLLLAIAVANARNDPPPSADRTWSPPNLPNYESELADYSSRSGSHVSINIFGEDRLLAFRGHLIGSRISTERSLMLSVINPTALPALRIAGTFFLVINLIGIVYIFRNRHRFFGRDPNVSDDIPAVRKLRVEVILIPWLFLTTLLVIVLINLWLQ